MDRRGLRLTILLALTSTICLVLLDTWLYRWTEAEPFTLTFVRGLFILSASCVSTFLFVRYHVGFARSVVDRLSRSEQRYTQLFKNHPEPMWVFDLDTLRILDVNAAAIEKYQYSESEFLEHSVDELRPAEDRSVYLDYLRTRKGKRQLVKGLWRHQKKDGAVFRVSVRSNRVQWDGKDSCLVAVTDVSEMIETWTDKRSVDEEMQHALQSLQMVADSIRDCHLFIDLKGIIVRGNTALFNYLEIKNQDLVGRHYRNMPSWVDQEMLESLMRSSRSTGVSTESEFHSPRTQDWYRFLCYPTPDGWNIFFRNISHEKAIELEVKEQHARLDALINNSDAIIVAVDTSFQITLFNDNFSKKVATMNQGLPRLGQDLRLCSKLEDIMDALLKALNSAFEGLASTFELPSKLYDGHERYVSIRLYPIWLGGRVTGVNIQIEDHHERVIHRRRLEQTNERLREIAQISAHQLRGPLSTVMTLLSMADGPDITDDDRKSILQLLSSTSSDVDTIVHELVERTKFVDE
jgi:PAS domain S-box-containing protein